MWAPICYEVSGFLKLFLTLHRDRLNGLACAGSLRSRILLFTRGSDELLPTPSLRSLQCKRPGGARDNGGRRRGGYAQRITQTILPEGQENIL